MWEDLFVLQFVNVTGFEKEHPWHGALQADHEYMIWKIQ